MSSGRPGRRTGVASAMRSTLPPSRPRSSDDLSIGVSMKPGGMVFTVMPLGPNSSASALVRPMSPALEDT
jgi:hypothetical protein